MKPKRNRRRSRGLAEWAGPLSVMAFIVYYSGNSRYTAAFVIALGGILLYLLIRHLAYLKKMRPLTISGVDKMSGPEFEHFVARLLRKQGYQVHEIGGYEDFGVDVIASRGQHRYAVQIKRWNQEVGIDAVRSVVTGVKYHDCTKAVVITNHYFTERAKSLAKVNECKLIDRDELANQLRAAA